MAKTCKMTTLMENKFSVLMPAVKFIKWQCFVWATGDRIFNGMAATPEPLGTDSKRVLFVKIIISVLPCNNSTYWPTTAYSCVELPCSVFH